MVIWKQLLVLVAIAVLGLGGYTGYLGFRAAETSSENGSGGQREVTVELALAELKVLQRTVEAVGTTRARQSVEIVPLASGRVVEVAIRSGKRVEAGDVLVRLDDDIERANLTEAEAQLAEQRQARERVQRLRESNTVSIAALEQAQSQLATAEAMLDRARRRLDDRVIRAPFAGVVGFTDVHLGARVDDESILTTLDDLSEVEIEFSLPETLFAEIAIGQPITAQSAAFSERTFVGRVASVDSRIDPVGRAFKVRAVVPNPEGVLPSGMFMSLTLTLSEAEALVVPEEAIVVQAAEAFVFTVEDGRATRRTVETGKRQEGVVAITSALEEGEAVVIRGLQRVRDGSPVRVVGEPAAVATSRVGSGS